MFNTVSQNCQSYYSQLPSGGLKSAGLSAIVSYTVNLSIIAFMQPHRISDLSRVGVAVALAVTASITHTLTTPIFNYLFNNPMNRFNGYEQCARAVFDLIFACFVVGLFVDARLKMSFLTTIMPHTILQAGADMMMRIMYRSAPNGVNSVFHGLQNLGINFNSNPNPIYAAF